MKDQPKVKLIIANATKINAEDRLIVVIPGADAMWIDEILAALESLTGHDQHAIIPVNDPDQVKFYAIEQTVQVEMAPPEGGIQF